VARQEGLAWPPKNQFARADPATMQSAARARCGAHASCSGSSGLRQRDAARGAGLRAGVRAAPAGARRAPLQVAAKLTKDGPHLCIVGTTGAVGQEFLSVRCHTAAAVVAHLPARGLAAVSPELPADHAAAAAAQVISGRNFPYSKLTLLGSSRCAPRAGSPACTSLHTPWKRTPGACRLTPRCALCSRPRCADPPA
jgi:hypothetical protein